MSDFKPVVGSEVSLPELTIKAIVLGAILSILLGAANVYLGMKAGMTVAASIPAAVVSMGVLRLFRRSNILENNIVQTAASAGESLAAGVIFTIPALVILKAWEGFDYWKVTAIASLGGVIGVMFTIPLRRALIVPRDLKFPEGLATAEVLKAGDSGKGIKTLALGGFIGAIFKLCESGFKFFGGIAQGAWPVGGSVAYLGTNLAPALVSVGFIVGINIAVLIFLGGVLNWWVAIPILAATKGLPQADTVVDSTFALWSTQTRYIGVGAMLVGGVWALLRMLPTLFRGAGAFLNSRKQNRTAGFVPLRERIDRDTPMRWVVVGLMICIIPLFFIFRSVTETALIAATMSVVMLFAGFLFAAVASYMAGLVGSSNNPVSGMTIATLFTAAILLASMGMESPAGPMAALFIGAVVCCAIAIGGDNMQDLKTGQLVGATPWKQQVMQMIGVLAGAVVMAPILTLLMEAYGIGPVFKEGQEPLQAPQATLMASVAQGVFDRDLPWPMVWIGCGLAALVILCDLALEAKKMAFRMPVLAVAVGLYLPLELGAAIFFGGMVAWAVNGFHLRRIANEADGELQNSMRQVADKSQRNGLLLAAGLITGEALLGILLAIPIVANQGVNPLKIETIAEKGLVWPGMILFVFILYLLYRTGTQTKHAPD